jgi:serine/threonine protein kinase
MKLWTPNQELKSGRFIIQKVMGGGGFGLTYKALDTSKDKMVVIKTLNQFQQTQEDFEQRQEKFLNEALRLAQCSHPHIVKVYEVFREEGLWGMVMEYVDGDDLGVYVENNGPLLETEALCYIEQISQALEYVHRQGFLHRDVKPNNILLRRETQAAILIDFGLAREYTGKTGSMTNAKTEGYAPIEQYERRGEFGEYTDVYALAATLYSLVTKEVPIPANFRKKGLSLPPPQQYNPTISDDLNAAIVRGMALEPQNRPQSVLEFQELLGIHPQAEAQLKSSLGINYSQLRNFLASGRWKEADRETARMMLAVTKREKEGWFAVEDIEMFRCEDLQIIDQLWLKYSHGRFGFTIQKRIYEAMGGNKDYDPEVWEAFSDRIGWHKNGDWVTYDHIIFDISAPVAHLPRGGSTVGEWGGFVLWLGLCGVFSRIDSCEL